MKLFLRILLLAGMLIETNAGTAAENASMDVTTSLLHPFHLQDLRLRDPYVWPDTNTHTYYLFNSTWQRGPNGRPAVITYTSKDLKLWKGPRVVFELPEKFWAQQSIWAPEMHSYHKKFYLFLTFNSTNLLEKPSPNWPPQVERGSQILVGDSPLGPFKSFANFPTLPTNMMTLDGTFWVDHNTPYMVFSHEWVQIQDGAIEAVKLKNDLSATVGKPEVLFRASEAPWSRRLTDYDCRVTDAPWLYRTSNGKLLMLWSSFSANGYAVGIAVSETGKLAGPWKQQPKPFFDKDGGHASLFYRFDGQLMMILHQPNEAPNERARLFEIEDIGDTIRLKNES